MFKKKPNIKTLSPLRSSDRRKVADRIIADYQLELLARHVQDPEDKAAAITAHIALRISLLPENSLSAKFTTTSGPDLKEVVGTVYVGSHGSTDQRVLWIKLEEKLYPSVYTLWRNPGILPLLHTHPPVVEKLRGGADLMTPGLARGPPFPPNAQKGVAVAIASTDSPSVPLFVGRCGIDVSALGTVEGQKGHAVHVLHWAGDEIWDWSSSGKAGAAAPHSIEGWDDADDGELTLRNKTLEIEDQEIAGGVALSESRNSQMPNLNAKNAVEGAEDDGDVRGREDEPEITTKDIDEAFRNAFLYGVYHHKEFNEGQPKFGLDFPLGQSFVMSTLVRPFLPTFTKKQTEALQIKKSSFKNIKKFIKSLDKQKILLSKDRDGNEVVIVDIDFDDRAITEFRPYPLPKKETFAGANLSQGEKAITTARTTDDSVGQKLKKIDLFRLKENLSTMFKGSDTSPNALLTASEIKSIVTNYLGRENLVSENNRRVVKLDPMLSNSVFSSDSKVDQDMARKGVCPRDALIDRIIQQSSPFHVILRSDQTVETTKTKPKAGAAPKVQILLETRSGNKTATTVHGVENFFISAQPLADELRKVCASSTSVEPFKGGKGMEVMVQGSQKDNVLNALEKRGVSKQWVAVLDKTKGKKR